jgi:hypothetical protein
VIAGGNLASALAAKAATTAIPILFAVAEDRPGSDLLPALHRRTDRNQVFQHRGDGKAGWNCCVTWCPERLVWPCSSIRPILLPRPRGQARNWLLAGLQLQVFNASSMISQRTKAACSLVFGVGSFFAGFAAELAGA